MARICIDRTSKNMANRVRRERVKGGALVQGIRYSFIAALGAVMCCAVAQRPAIEKAQATVPSKKIITTNDIVTGKVATSHMNERVLSR